MPQTLTGMLAFLIELVIWLIIIDSVITNIIAFGGRISIHQPAVRLLRQIVNPILSPVRRLLPPYKTGGMDLSPIIVILLLYFAKHLLYGY